MNKLFIILSLLLVSDYSQFSNKLGNGISIVSGQGICSDCACGILRQGRIKGGNHVRKAGKYPWIARLDIAGVFCGGSLIKSKYVLTAAHCVYQKNMNEITVSLMEHDLRTDADSNLVQRGVSGLMIHPYYTPQINDHDIALLRLNLPVQVGVFPGMPLPVCLTRGDASFAGTDAVSIGWGRTFPNSNLSPVLKEIVIPVLFNSQCEQIYPNQVTQNKICAGLPDRFTGPLQGDSGGPLMNIQNGKYTLIGVVSGGIPEVGTTMFTRVSRYLGWITQNSADNCWCN